MEMEIGNGNNIKVAGLLAALIDLRVVAGLLFVCIQSSSRGAAHSLKSRTLLAEIFGNFD